MCPARATPPPLGAHAPLRPPPPARRRGPAAAPASRCLRERGGAAQSAPPHCRAPQRPTRRARARATRDDAARARTQHNTTRACTQHDTARARTRHYTARPPARALAPLSLKYFLSRGASTASSTLRPNLSHATADSDARSGPSTTCTRRTRARVTFAKEFRGLWNRKIRRGTARTRSIRARSSAFKHNTRGRAQAEVGQKQTNKTKLYV